MGRGTVSILGWNWNQTLPRPTDHTCRPAKTNFIFWPWFLSSVLSQPGRTAGFDIINNRNWLSLDFGLYSTSIKHFLLILFWEQRSERLFECWICKTNTGLVYLNISPSTILMLIECLSRQSAAPPTIDFLFKLATWSIRSSDMEFLRVSRKCKCPQDLLDSYWVLWKNISFNALLGHTQAWHAVLLSLCIQHIDTTTLGLTGLSSGMSVGVGHLPWNLNDQNSVLTQVCLGKLVSIWMVVSECSSAAYLFPTLSIFFIAVIYLNIGATLMVSLCVWWPEMKLQRILKLHSAANRPLKHWA